MYKSTSKAHQRIRESGGKPEIHGKRGSGSLRQRNRAKKKRLHSELKKYAEIYQREQREGSVQTVPDAIVRKLKEHKCI